ncbi:MAG TPA: DinB family protein [Gemmatimonadales bacterium]
MAEPWLRGPVPDVPPLLQPVAHALLLAMEDVRRVVPPLTAEQLHARPGGAASVAFHVVHAAGSLDRLFTYARGESLDDAQMDALRAEKDGLGDMDSAAVVTAFGSQVEHALAQLRATDESTVLDAREVGRAKLPSNVLGLLFHAAEHTQRHVGQTITTARVVAAG